MSSVLKFSIEILQQSSVDSDLAAAASPSIKPVLLLSACCSAGRTDPATSLYPGLVGGLLGQTGPSPTPPSCSTGLPVGQCSAYQWRLSNKYYEADVEIVEVPEPLLGSQELADAVEAVGLYFCPGQRRCFDVAKSWLAYLEHLEPEVRFLVTSDRLGENVDEVSRDEAVGWCVGNGFELIELASAEAEAATDDEDVEEEDDDRCGLERMRQALHSHPWPNLVMRSAADRQESDSMRRIREQLLAERAAGEPGEDKPMSASPSAAGDSQESLETADKEEAAAAAAAVASAISSAAAAASSSPSTVPVVDEALLDRVYDDDEDGRRLESLFARVMRAKAQADQLPVHSAERRELAANVIAGLWRELGMPEGELDGLEDDSDEEEDN